MYPWLEPVAPVLSALVMAVMFQDSFRREAESLLRQHWASLNGGAEKRIVVTKKGAEAFGGLSFFSLMDLFCS